PVVPARLVHGHNRQPGPVRELRGDETGGEVGVDRVAVHRGRSWPGRGAAARPVSTAPAQCREMPRTGWSGRFVGVRGTPRTKPGGRVAAREGTRRGVGGTGGSLVGGSRDGPRLGSAAQRVDVGAQSGL